LFGLFQINLAEGVKSRIQKLTSILNLESAIFNNAYLRWANFTGAYLTFAEFNRASLSHTTFSGANLTKAEFKGAFIKYAYFNNCYVIIGDYPMESYLPTAPEGYEFIFETNEDGIIRTKIVHEGTPHETEGCYIKLIKTETKNP